MVWFLKGPKEFLSFQKASQVIAQNTKKHLDVCRHQAFWSVFPWQQGKTPSPLSSDALQTPFRRDFCASHFPQKQEESPSSRSTLQVGQRGAHSSFCDNPSSSQLSDQQKAQSQGNVLSQIGFPFSWENVRIIPGSFSPSKCLRLLFATSVVSIPGWWCAYTVVLRMRKISQVWRVPLFLLISWDLAAFKSRTSAFDVSFQKEGE